MHTRAFYIFLTISEENKGLDGLSSLSWILYLLNSSFGHLS
jgi:hypothetical protein